MVIVAKKVFAEQLLDESAVGIVWCVAVSKLPGNALMDLNYGQQAHFSSSQGRALRIERLDLIADSLEELRTNGPDQTDIFEHDFKEVAILLIINLQVVRVHVNVAPRWIADPLQNDVQYLEDGLASSSR